MTLPNFFIIGAPKCGTTSIARYLSQHERVFFCEPKEPNYLARSLSMPGGFLSQQAWHTDYETWVSLFSGATQSHIAVGEGSTRYLRCVPALNEIKSSFPAAKLVVCLRNPAELAESWHAQKLWEGQEDERVFEVAWNLQGPRDRGEIGLPKGLAERDALKYSSVAAIGSQLVRVLELFSKEQVLIVSIDDLRAEPRSTYLSILKFLDVPDDGRVEFPRLNARRKRRLTLRNIARSVRDALFGDDEPPTQVPPSDEFRQQLRGHFRSEVDLLESVTGRALATWY